MDRGHAKMIKSNIRKINDVFQIGVSDPIGSDTRSVLVERNATQHADAG